MQQSAPCMHTCFVMCIPVSLLVGANVFYVSACVQALLDALIAKDCRDVLGYAAPRCVPRTTSTGIVNTCPTGNICTNNGLCRPGCTPYDGYGMSASDSQCGCDGSYCDSNSGTCSSTSMQQVSGMTPRGMKSALSLLCLTASG